MKFEFLKITLDGHEPELMVWGEYCSTIKHE